MNWTIAPAASLALALLIGAGALTAHAGGPRAGAAEAGQGGNIGSIDMEEIYNASGSPQELEQAARKHEAEGAQRINRIMAVPYLEPAELEEFGGIVGKAVATAEDEKRATALKAANDQRAGELGVLQSKANDALSAADKTRLAHLVELRQTLQTQVRPGLLADFRTQHEGWMGDYRHRQIVMLRQEVGKVAKERKIAHVFDAGTLVFSENDLTPTVLQRLAKRTGRR